MIFKYNMFNIMYVFIVLIEVVCSFYIIKGVIKKSEKKIVYVVIIKDENWIEVIFI